MGKPIDWWEVLDLFCWGVSMLAMPSVSAAMRGFEADRYRTLGPGFWRRLEKEKWLVRRGQGPNAEFTITEKGRQYCAQTDPRKEWNRPWDRKWRVITFDVPDVRAKDRVALWREFRARRLGLLQRSVWIWPRDLEEMLDEVIYASGIPERFAGLECTRLFLCTNEEIVRTAWDFGAIKRVHNEYLSKSSALCRNIHEAADLSLLASFARQERVAYQSAMEEDPLLPQELWPPGYLGAKVYDRHEASRVELGRCLRRLLAAQSQ